MFRSFRYLSTTLAILTLAPMAAQGSSLNLNNLTQGNFNSMVKELSADMSYSSVTPASSLGLWGFELGATGGITRTPDIQSFVKQADPNTSFKNWLPHAGGLLRVGAPLGLTGELIYLPKIHASNMSLNELGIAAQWTITDLFFSDLPVTMAIKGFYTRTSLDYSQSFSNTTTGGIPVTGNIDFTDKIYGSQFLVSKKLFIFEPYVGVGYVHSKGTLTVSAAGAATIFTPTFTSSNAASYSPASAEFLAGLDIKVFVLSIGAEYENLYSRSSYTGRVSFRF